MDKTAVEAKLVMDKLHKSEQLKDEFEKLAPSPFNYLIKFALLVGINIYATWRYPELSGSPLLYILWLYVILFVMDSFQDNRRAHKRIDALYKLVKNDT